ncbi:hypothetical protein FQA39_LY08922 [Lamprigera yunnana]|nr:hypothetical protein FQA39_LY08922 [Lamprigera yunnana]
MSQNYTVPLQYGPDGCRICGEMQTLDIIKEFNRFYESKLQEINSIGGGDGLQAKVMLQQNWIRDLTQQNEMLVKVVEQLEKVAADRVSMLEEHLQNSTSVGAKVMQRYKDNFSIYLNETFQKMEWLQSDVCNLINFVKRVRDYNEWNVKGLKFYTLNPNILLSNCDCVTCEYPSSLIEKLKDMEELSHSPKDVEELNFKLHLKDEELSSVKRSMMEVRDSLFLEVSKKQDELLTLRCDLQKLEERCRLADKECQCKNNYIKELELQIKLLREKPNELDKPHSFVFDVKERDCEILTLRNNIKRLEQNSKEESKKSQCKDTNIVELQCEVEQLRKQILHLQSLKCPNATINTNTDCPKGAPSSPCSKVIKSKPYSSDTKRKCSKSQQSPARTGAEFKQLSVSKGAHLSCKPVVPICQDTNKHRRVKGGLDSPYFCLYESGDVSPDHNLLSKENFISTKNSYYKFNTDTFGASKTNLYSEAAFRSMDIETDCNELRKKFKESEKENQSLKDTIFQANRELEKLYDQANEYLKERDNFKQKFKSSLDQLDMLKNQNSFDRQQLESQSCIFEETIEKLNNENASIKKVKDELVNIKLQNESLSQAQNETIQALQEAIHEKDKPSLQSKALPFATSDASWLSVSESDKLLDKCVDGKTSNLADVASLMLNKSEFEVCSTSTCPPTCYGVEELEKLQKEREIERQKHLKEVDNLKKTIKELESNSSGTETTKLLEEVQVKAKLEISRQRTTISNLQDALKTCKNQLDEIKQKSSSDIKNLNCVINHLQDANLDLEVKIFEYVQDVAILEARVLKYQFDFKVPTSDVYKENDNLRGKINQLQCECDGMKRIVKEAKELHKSYVVMQAKTEDFQLEAKVAQQELLRETQMKERDTSCIQELKVRLGEKSCEMSEIDNALRDTEKKLCWTLCQNNQLKTEMSVLLNHMSHYEQSYADNDERTNVCQQEIEVCKESLTELNNKLLMMKDILQQKIDQYSQLESEFCMQNNSLISLKQELCISKKEYEDQICTLHCKIQELQNKLIATESAFKHLQEEYQHCKGQQMNYTCVEDQLENELSSTLQASQLEVKNLNSYVTQLQEECSCIKQESTLKEQQIASLKAQIMHLKSSESVELENTKSDVNELKNELNRTLQQQDILKAKNEALCLQLCETKQTVYVHECENKNIEHHLHQYLCELKHLRKIRDQLEAVNQDYLQELDRLRCSHEELNKNYQKVIASVSILENDVTDYKNKNESLCIESRNLMKNVRAWLGNQVLINQQVSQKFNDDQLVICNLKRKVAILSKCKKKCTSRLRGGSVAGTSKETFSSFESLATEANSQSFHEIDNDGYSNDEFDGASTQLWIKKVNDMRQELYNSGEYWRKISDDYLVTRDE